MNLPSDIVLIAGDSRWDVGKPTHFLDERGTAIEALDIMPTRRMVKETFIWQD